MHLDADRPKIIRNPPLLVLPQQCSRRSWRSWRAATSHTVTSDSDVTAPTTGTTLNRRHRRQLHGRHGCTCGRTLLTRSKQITSTAGALPAASTAVLQRQRHASRARTY